MKLEVKVAKDRRSFQIKCPYSGVYRTVTTIPCILMLANADHTHITIVKVDNTNPREWQGLYSGEYTDEMKEEVKGISNLYIADEDDKLSMIN